jgi:proline racemase
VTVFADGEVDRSPCGSGTSARLALLDAAGGGPLERGATLVHRSIVDSVFTGRVVGDGPTVGGRRLRTALAGSTASAMIAASGPLDR